MTSHRHSGRAPRLLAIGLAISTTACGSGGLHRVEIIPVSTDKPVSASAQYLDGQGEPVVYERYEPIRGFRFAKTVEAPTGAESVASLDLTPDFQEILRDTQADALVDVQIGGTEFSEGSYGTKSMFKIMGGSYVGVGALFGLTALAMDDDSAGLFGGIGASFLGLGLLSYLAVLLLDEPSYWRIEVQGNAVRAR